MRDISMAVVLGALGALTAYFLIDVLMLPPFSQLAILVRCATLTPCTLWIDRQLCTTPRYIVSILLWAGFPIGGMLLWLLLPRQVWPPDPPEVGLVREGILVLQGVAVPGTAFAIADYCKKRSSSERSNDLPRGRTERD